ncbi:MAG: ABC transporter permease [Actinobacteria bacterium]|nr:ABC transporter permease [Actinomycetota bacterium]
MPNELRTAQRRGSLALAGRESRRVLALWSQTLLPPVLTGCLFLAVFGGALADRIGPVEGVPYLDFILPGLLIVTVAGQAFSNNSTSLYQAKSEGYIDDLLTSPLRPSQLAFGYMVGGLLRGLLAALAITLAAMPFTGGIERPEILAGTLVLTGILFAALGVLTGIWADTFDQHASVANVVVTPLALLGGVFYSVDSLSEPWATLTRIDPLLYLVDTTRAGVSGTSATHIAVSLLVASAITASLFVGLTALLARGWRLKP